MRCKFENRFHELKFLIYREPWHASVAFTVRLLDSASRVSDPSLGPDVIVFCAGFCGTRILAPEVVLCFVKRFHNCAVPFTLLASKGKGKRITRGRWGSDPDAGTRWQSKIASVSNLLLKPVTHPVFDDDYA